MEIRDGFIVGIHNYCDRGCERCAFTSYCRVFADVAEMDASLDPNLRAIVEAPLLETREPQTPTGMQEILADEASTTMPTQEVARYQPVIPAEHQPIEARAFAYATRLHEWLKVRDGVGPWHADEPCAVIARFGVLIAMKVRREAMSLEMALDPPSRWRNRRRARDCSRPKMGYPLNA